jgi:ribonuclease G
LVDEVENNLRYITQQLNIKKITINTHPFVEAFINKRIGLLSSLRKQWQTKYKATIDVLPSSAYSFLEYHFVDDKGEEIHI